MYLRPVFAVTDLDRIAGLIAANPFGVLVTTGADGMSASHLPFVVVRAGDTLVLEAHFGAANAQCAALAGGAALAVFSGPHAYIAPGWYEAQPSVPTWDYAAVHIHGHLEPVCDEPDMTACMHRLAAGDPHGFDVEALPEKYRRAMYGGIRAFRLRAERIEAQWKMSQNRSVADRLAVSAALRAQGDEAVASLIEATLPVAPTASPSSASPTAG